MLPLFVIRWAQIASGIHWISWPLPTIHRVKREDMRNACWPPARERILRHQKDTVYGSICRFFDTTERRCTIYEARPGVCREYPNGSRCGYYTFIQFERKHQDDPDFIPSA